MSITKPELVKKKYSVAVERSCSQLGVGFGIQTAQPVLFSSQSICSVHYFQSGYDPGQ